MVGVNAVADPNLKDFYVRLGRIEKIRRAGGGFEAAGTLGLSRYAQYARPQRRSLPIFRPLLVVFIAVIGIKGLIHHQVGADTYAARVEALRQGGSVDQVGAFMMQADPLTVFVSAQIRDLFS